MQIVRWSSPQSETTMTEEDARGRPPRRLSEALDDALRRLRGPDRKVAGTVFSRWREIVGDSIADHATPARLKDNCLTIDVEDATWLTQLRFLHDQILTTLRQHTDDAIESIDFRVARQRRE